MLDVVLAHAEKAEPWVGWSEAYDMGCVHGFRNSQVTLLAPTGTIGMVMDADTTGVEPEYDLVTYKTLAGGGIARRVRAACARRQPSWDEKRAPLPKRCRPSRARAGSGAC